MTIIFKQRNYQQMSFKATVDIAINFSSVRIKQFHKIGFIRYRTSIYYQHKKKNYKVHAFPYIFKSYETHKNGIIPNNILNIQQPYIDQESIYFNSRLVPVKYMNRSFTENCTCFFKIYVDTAIMDQIQYFSEVDLIFVPIKQDQPVYKEAQVISTFKAKINKFHSILTYMPISFDSFQAISVSGLYNATIVQFKFQKNQILEEEDSGFIFSSKKSIQYQDFQQYLKNTTQNFVFHKLRTFYNYYHQFLINQLQSLHKRYKEYMDKYKFKKTFVQKNNIGINQKILKKINQIYDKDKKLISPSQIKILGQLILQDYSLIKAQIYKIWQEFNEFIMKHSLAIAQDQKVKYNQFLQERFKNNIFSHKIKNCSFKYSKYDDSGKSHIESALKENQKRASEGDIWIDSFPIQNISLLQNQQKNIKMFEQIYQTNSKIYFQSNKQQQPKKHFIYLVHGFQASKLDLLLLKYCLQTKYKVNAIISSANVGRTQDNIQQSGTRLADEITKYLDLIEQPFKLSFIGHSMGGLIIRSALTKLKKYESNLHSFISICTPHLGYLYAPSNIIKVGLWILSKVQKCDSVEQIQMKDNQNLRQCYLYKLAQKNTLSQFKNIAFVSSSQDEYVPYQSARVQKSFRILQKQIKNTQQSKIIVEMVDNILKNIKAEYISRIDVVFNFQEKNFDTMIGRTGHVKFLSDQQFIREFVICFKKFFI